MSGWSALSCLQTSESDERQVILYSKLTIDVGRSRVAYQPLQKQITKGIIDVVGSRKRIENSASSAIRRPYIMSQFSVSARDR